MGVHTIEETMDQGPRLTVYSGEVNRGETNGPLWILKSSD